MSSFMPYLIVTRLQLLSQNSRGDFNILLTYTSPHDFPDFGGEWQSECTLEQLGLNMQKFEPRYV